MAGCIKLSALRFFGRLTGGFGAYAVSAVILACASAAFTWELFKVEGTVFSAAAVWALATVPFLPAFGALVAARAWSDDRVSGYLNTLLASPVKERELVLGRFFASLVVGMLLLIIHWAFTTLVLSRYSPGLEPQLGLLPFLPAFLGLMMPLALVTAVGIWSGLQARNGATAALLSLFLTLFLPIAVYAVVATRSPVVRAVVPESPFLTFAQSAADGSFSFSGVAFYLVFVFVALFAASKRLAALRFVGTSARGLRWSSRLAVFLALMFAILVCAVSWRFDFSVTLPGSARVKRFSERTRQILAETRGDVQVTCFVPRSSPSFRSAYRLVTGLKEEARRLSGVRIHAEFVDPRWDLHKAERLVKRGCPEGGIYFRCGRRRFSVTNVIDEANCAVALVRLTRPIAREKVYWTIGHGETSWRDYDSAYGMSDIARMLQREGYRIEDVDLGHPVPFDDDCAFVVSAGARTAYSSDERKRLEGYLRKGGRMLIFTGATAASGLNTLLGDWGIATSGPMTDVPTERIVRSLSDHQLTRPLWGETLVFGTEAARFSMAQSVDTNRLDGLAFTPLAADEDKVFSVALEYGGSAERDLALRPVRVVVVGDPAFAVNGALTRRANANADFVINAAAWLAGFDASAGVSRGADTLVTGLVDRKRTRYSIRACLFAPCATLLLGVIVGVIRRRST